MSTHRVKIKPITDDPIPLCSVWSYLLQRRTTSKQTNIMCRKREPPFYRCYGCMKTFSTRGTDKQRGLTSFLPISLIHISSLLTPNILLSNLPLLSSSIFVSERSQQESMANQTRTHQDVIVRDSRSTLDRDHPKTGAQMVKVATGVAAGGSLLVLSGLTLAGTVIALAVATPLLIIFSPVLVPAVITVVLIITGFLASGGFGIAAITAFSWLYR